MSADLHIEDGTPGWLSPSIVPSRDTVQPTSAPPLLATVHPSSNNVFVYVLVENNGTVDLGGCGCASLGAWAVSVPFAGYLSNKSLSKTDSSAGVTFKASPAGDSLSGGVTRVLSSSVPFCRAWGWSPDGRYFAYASSTSGPDWSLTIISLQNTTRSDGTLVSKGQLAATTNGVFIGAFSPTTFGWAGSRAVVSSGKNNVGIARTVLCPEAPGGTSWGETVPDFPGQLDWANLVSPCASVIAFVPKILVAAFGSRNAYLVSVTQAAITPFKKGNVPTTVTISGPNPTINTVGHTANGVSIVTGGGTVTVDDPDCTGVTIGITVHVDRVKASTLPSGNLGVVSVGTAIAGPLAVGAKRWVQIPPPAGWANQSETHWCLLAQAYTTDKVAIPVAWNGQAPSPSSFPQSLDNCAQRNIDIVP